MHLNKQRHYNIVCGTMSELVKKHKHYIYLLSETSSSHQRKALVDTITKEQFRALSQVIVNALHLNIPLEKSVVSKLKSHRKTFALLSDRKVGVRKRLKVFKSRYNIVIYMLKAAVPTLRSIERKNE